MCHANSTNTPWPCGVALNRSELRFEIAMMYTDAGAVTITVRQRATRTYIIARIIGQWRKWKATGARVHSAKRQDSNANKKMGRRAMRQ